MRRPEYKYLVAAIYVVALFMDLLDTTIVNVALPSIGRSLHADTAAIEWVVTGYLLSLAVFIPVSGWAGDRFGSKRIFLLALVVFIAGSLACTLSWNIESLVASRILQGIGGGMLTPVGAAMVYRAFRPDERARVAPFITVPAVVAPACGPIVGGLLLQSHAWPSVFAVNIPIGLFGLLFAALLLREHREQNPGRFDPAGFVLGAVGLSALLYALAQAGRSGFGDVRTVIFGIAGMAALAAFAIVELRTAQPMIDLRLFLDPLFRIGNAVQSFGFGAQFGTLFLLPLLLQAERGLSPLQSGLTTFPQAVGVMTMAAVAGRVYARVGPRRMAAAGLSLATIATLALLGVGLQTNEWWIRCVMLVRGWGFALSLTAMQAATFATVPSESMGRGSSIYSVTRQVSTSLTVAFLALVLSSGLLAHGATLGDPRTREHALLAFHEAFAASAILSLAGAVLALWVRDSLADGTRRRSPASPAAPGAEVGRPEATGAVRLARSG